MKMGFKNTVLIALTLMFSVILASCALSPKTAVETHELTGTIYDATMSTLAVIDSNENIYGFAKNDDTNISTEEGIVIGYPVMVKYQGTLDPSQQMQSVEIVQITVFASDASKKQLTQEQLQAMLADMSLEEKIGQMFIARCPQENAVAMVSQYHLGGYILFGRDFKEKTKIALSEEVASYQEASTTKMFIGVDEEGGKVNRVSLYQPFRATPFRSAQDLFAEGGWDLIVSDTIEKANLLQSLGINLNLAPVCDVSEDPADYIYGRTFGKNAKETARYVKTVVETMDDESLGSVLKHFPGYGNNADTHTGIANDARSYKNFQENDFLPFQAGIDAGGGAVLVSHNIVSAMDNTLPASLSPAVHKILREELAFDGVIMTDDLYMEAIKQFTGDSEAAVLAVQAGNDMICCTNFETQIPAVINAVKEGTIAEEQIDQSVLRILQWKTSLGIL